MSETEQVDAAEAVDTAAAETEGTDPVETPEAPEAPKAKKKCTGVSQDAKITILVDANPKRPGSASYARFEGYLTEKAPATVKEALENGLIMGDIHYDFIHGSIAVEGAEVVEYMPATRGPRAEKAKDDDSDAEQVVADSEAEVSDGSEDDDDDMF